MINRPTASIAFGLFFNAKKHNMETLQNLGKLLTQEDQKKIKGGWDACWNMHGQYGGCKTDAACPLDLPICEPF
jgi:hypothetical protein